MGSDDLTGFRTRQFGRTQARECRTGLDLVGWRDGGQWVRIWGWVQGGTDKGQRKKGTMKSIKTHLDCAQDLPCLWGTNISPYEQRIHVKLLPTRTIRLQSFNVGLGVMNKPDLICMYCDPQSLLVPSSFEGKKEWPECKKLPFRHYNTVSRKTLLKNLPHLFLYKSNIN